MATIIIRIPKNSGISTQSLASSIKTIISKLTGNSKVNVNVTGGNI